MATEFDQAGDLTLRFAQLSRVGTPFNPVLVEGIAGENAKRLQKSMDAFNWSDPRFVTREQAERNGWEVDAEAVSAKIPVRNPMTGLTDEITLVNAADVKGMPSLDAMLKLPEADLVAMQEGRFRSIDRQDGLSDDIEDALTIGPADALELGVSKTLDPFPPLDTDLTRDVENEADKNASSRFAVMAPYWRNGMHNHEGIAAASELNKKIAANKLAEDKDAIARLLAAHPTARKFGVSLVDERLYLEDPDLKMNPAQPAMLLGGALVRDKAGAYRPKEGGKALLQDMGNSLSLKSRTPKAYQAAMELAHAKGWTAIELKGKPAVLADAWLESQMMEPPLRVVNYKPSEKDVERLQAREKERFDARSALEAKQKKAEKEKTGDGVANVKTIERTPEIVVVKPFIDAHGQTKIAQITYTVSYENQTHKFGNAKDAAKLFAGLPASAGPTVTRAVTRADGEVESDVIAGTDRRLGSSAPVRATELMLDEEFDQAMEEVIEEQKAVDSLKLPDGLYSGPVTDIDLAAGRFAQKSGRDASKVVWHSLSVLQGALPAKGAVVDIEIKKGLAKLKLKEKSLEVGDDSGGRQIGR